MSENFKKRAFVRLDAKLRVIPGTLILRKTKPRNGKWLEVANNVCCTTTTTTSTTTTTTTTT